MSNPLLGGGKPPMMNNPINNVLNFMNNGGDIRSMANQMLSNPQANQRLAQMKNMIGNKSPKDFVLQVAKQQGVSENQIMQLANKLGLK